MQVSVNLSEKQAEFLQEMVADSQKFGHVGTIEDAIRECIVMAMYEEGELTAMQEGM
jgi:Arc/MetJ-type ribon-helix-helix transcriptional regulator